MRNFFLAAVGVGLAAAGCGSSVGTASGGGGGTTSMSSGVGGLGASTSSASVTSTGTTIDPGGLDCSPPAAGGVPQLQLTPIGGTFSSPVLVTYAPRDASRLYVVEQTGAIRIVKIDAHPNGDVLPKPFLDISSLVTVGGEQGLLGLAFHPKYQQNGRFWVSYSDKATGAMTVAEFARSATDPDRADPTPKPGKLSQADPESNHNGGMITFSPLDGHMYLGWGDGGGGFDQHGACGNGQNLGVLFAKIHRIDVDAAGPINPVMWDYGLRNPWRFSFDGCSGDLYIGDVGQNATEEVDVEPAGQGGKNYGWRCFEGNAPTAFPNGYTDNTSCPCDPTNMTPPVLTYDHTVGIAVVGGFVYRGSAIPGLRGTYFFGDYGVGHVWTTQWSAGTATAAVDHAAELGTQGTNISSFGQDARGEIYICNLSGSIGRIDAR